MPEIPALRRLTQSIAMLDAIVCPEWESRYYSFNSSWSEGAEMASMRDGCGDEWFLLFDHYGAALKGLAHGSPLVRGTFAARLRETVPSGFAGFLDEPAFSMSEASFCLWRRQADSMWNVVPAQEDSAPSSWDGSEEMLRILDGIPATYKTWAEEYYERDIFLAAVQAIYAHEPLSVELVTSLKAEIALPDLAADQAQIAYPRT